LIDVVSIRGLMMATQAALAHPGQGINIGSFLASPAARQITGTGLDVDGGVNA